MTEIGPFLNVVGILFVGSFLPLLGGFTMLLQGLYGARQTFQITDAVARGTKQAIAAFYLTLAVAFFGVSIMWPALMFFQRLQVR